MLLIFKYKDLFKRQVIQAYGINSWRRSVDEPLEDQFYRNVAVSFFLLKIKKFRRIGNQWG